MYKIESKYLRLGIEAFKSCRNPKRRAFLKLGVPVLLFLRRLK